MVSFRPAAWLLALAPFVQDVVAQASAATRYVDAGTGIIFDSWLGTNMRFGLTFPSNALTVDATETIGILECANGAAGTGTGWCGVSFGGPMTNSLLLMAWPEDDDILTSFRLTSDYESAPLYTGAVPTLTQIASSQNATHYKLIYRCVGCLEWTYSGTSRKLSTSAGGFGFGWAWANASPTNGACPRNVVINQHTYQSVFGATLDANGANSQYSQWAALPAQTVNGNCGGGTTTTSAPPSSTTSSIPEGTGIPVPSGSVYDYIVVGAGAGGIPIADKLSEAGKKVLLIEKGPPSSGRWGGKMKPKWLQSTNLTRFDVPGLCNQIWRDSAGIACRDTDQMAGCILGGGTAINAGLWWKPNPADWDYNFPEGWKASDMTAATNRVFSRIPGTTVPSMDGKLYLQQGYNVISGGLKASGWTEVNANSVPGQKNRTFTHTPYMFSGGERGGPMATYLVSADKRNNFDMWTNTQVKKVIRKGGHITGVEVENYAGNGYKGTVNVTPASGRVVLSAGTFGSAKILMRSGIGPEDQLKIVQASSTDKATMIAAQDWIKLPVGYNLEDHTNTDLVISHPDVVHYDFYASFEDPPDADELPYLSGRRGILAQAAPNIGPLFFEEVRGADNIVRSIQWTARVEGNAEIPDGKAMVISQYLGRGAVSRGRMTIGEGTNGLSTIVSGNPYLNNKDDKEAIIKSIENLQASLKNVKGLVWEQPKAGITAREYVDSLLVSYANRRANHWIGTNKMGTKDGRKGGDSVVDTNTQVYGTDNLFVVDASIFPGMVTTNPSAYIVIASEHATTKILAKAAPKQNAKFAQCGGQEWAGSFDCASGSTCQFQNAYYSQCL